MQISAFYSLTLHKIIICSISKPTSKHFKKISLKQNMLGTGNTVQTAYRTLLGNARTGSISADNLSVLQGI